MACQYAYMQDLCATHAIDIIVDGWIDKVFFKSILLIEMIILESK